MPGVSVGHVDGVLLVLDGDEADAGGLEDVQGVHERAADDSETVLDIWAEGRKERCRIKSDL